MRVRVCVCVCVRVHALSAAVVWCIVGADSSHVRCHVPDIVWLYSGTFVVCHPKVATADTCNLSP